MFSITFRVLFAFALVAMGSMGNLLVQRKVQQIRAGQVIALNRPLAEFPREIDGWTSKDVPISKESNEQLKPDDYLQRIYTHPSGDQITVWMNFSKTSRDQFHYPTVCMPGRGWEEQENARLRTNIRNGLPGGTEQTGHEMLDDLIGSKSQQTDANALASKMATDVDSLTDVPTLRLSFRRDSEVKHVYYWYYLLGEDAIDRTMRQLAPYARIFLRGRRNGSMTIELFYEGNTSNLPRIDRFAQVLTQQLKAWIPDGADADCSLGAAY